MSGDPKRLPWSFNRLRSRVVVRDADGHGPLFIIEGGANPEALAMLELAMNATPSVSAAPVVTEAMVTRFLAWKLPQTFAPDCGISFDGRGKDAMGYEKTWPVGTNLLTATEARAMLEHVLQAPPVRAVVSCVGCGAEYRPSLNGVLEHPPTRSRCEREGMTVKLGETPSERSAP